jgi:hypothetical protein
MFTSSYPEELKAYKKRFEEENIFFNFVNENPEINEAHFGYYKDKWYFDVLFEDKAGFNPEEWKDIYEFMKNNPWRPKEVWRRTDI